MREILSSFLETEITDQEYYDGIIQFIYSANIRYGEYECNQFVVKKCVVQNRSTEMCNQNVHNSALLF